MLYLLCNPSVAEQLNRSFMRLMRPAHLRDGYTTDLYTTCHTHPVTGYCALAMPNPVMVPIHLESDGAEFVALLDTFVADGAMTQAEADSLAVSVADVAGESINLLDFVPDSWSAYILTKEQMDLAGWFPPAEGV